MELERGTAKELRRILEASGGTRETPVKLHIKSLLPLWLLVTMPNLNSLRRLEVAFFGRFLSRFYGRHYWPLFRKLACE